MGECCVLPCKDTKLKAIHNWHALLDETEMLCFTVQRYKIESNSQHVHTSFIAGRGCVLPCKDTKLKAIHNVKTFSNVKKEVVFYRAKIQN